MIEQDINCRCRFCIGFVFCSCLFLYPWDDYNPFKVIDNLGMVVRSELLRHVHYLFQCLRDIHICARLFS